MWLLLPNQERNKASLRSLSSKRDNVVVGNQSSVTGSNGSKSRAIGQGYTLLLLPLAIASYSLVQSFLLAHNSRFTQVVVNQHRSSSDDTYNADLISTSYLNYDDHNNDYDNEPTRGYGKKNDKKQPSLSKKEVEVSSRTTLLAKEDTSRDETSKSRRQRKDESSSRSQKSKKEEDLDVVDVDTMIEKPEIVWLASYPNSGTSYTMTLVERGSNLSTASNYGPEVTPPKGSSSIPVHSNYPDGPYWEGHKNAKLMRHTIRDLPTNYVLTKTHCGGRCIKCPATDYVVNHVEDYVKACQRSTAVDETGHATENLIPTERISKLIHLIRNPIDNTVSRFHLERRHLVTKDPKKYEALYPLNFTGFQQWCTDLDNEFSYAEKIAISSSTTRTLMEAVPCRAEFFKFAQWHNMLLQTIHHLGHQNINTDNYDDDDSTKKPIPVYTLYYENYHLKFHETVHDIFQFLNQTTVQELREFRSLPDYSDHYTKKQLSAIHDLVKRVSSDETWSLVHHYFDKLVNIEQQKKQQQVSDEETQQQEQLDIYRQLKQLNDIIENKNNTMNDNDYNNEDSKEQQQQPQQVSDEETQQQIDIFSQLKQLNDIIENVNNVMNDNDHNDKESKEQQQQPRQLKSLSSIHQQFRLH